MRKVPTALCLLAAFIIAQMGDRTGAPLDSPINDVCEGAGCESAGPRLSAAPSAIAPDAGPSTLVTAFADPAGPEEVEGIAVIQSALSEPWRPVLEMRAASASFAYANSHPVKPLPAAVAEKVAPTDDDWFAAFEMPASTMADDVQRRAVRAMARIGLCSAIVAAARGYDLPIPFFANLIWQESSFRFETISTAGALGVAQFMPETAKEFGLLNPFEPVHAVYTAGKFLRRLHDQFGNLGFAAAAYNAGPGRLNEWLVKRRVLPAETRAYVARITGRPVDRWAAPDLHRDPARDLMPARAPCEAVAEEVKEQTRLVRITQLMKELVAATEIPVSPPPLPRPNPMRQHIAGKPAASQAAATARTAPASARVQAVTTGRGDAVAARTRTAATSRQQAARQQAAAPARAGAAAPARAREQTPARVQTAASSRVQTAASARTQPAAPARAKTAAAARTRTAASSAAEKRMPPKDKSRVPATVGSVASR